MLIEKYINKCGCGVIVLFLSLFVNPLNAGEILNQLEKELSHLIEIAKPSVVSITSTVSYVYYLPSESSSIPFWGQKSKKKQTIKIRNVGSGLIIDKDGHIITKSNVVQDAEKIEVILFNNEIYLAEFINYDVETGLAVIKITTDDLVPAQLGTTDDIRIGKWIAIMGNSIGVSSSISLGLINGIREENNLIQLSAFINPGNSGSPIFNIEGKVIGIVAARLNAGNLSIGTTDGIQSFEGGIAYPVNLISETSQKLIENRGKKKAYLGIITQDVDGENGLVLIKSVIENSPAQKAGLQENDFLVKVNGKKINNSKELMEIGEKLEPGSKFNLTVKREQEYLDYEITLSERPPHSPPLLTTTSSDFQPVSSIPLINYETAQSKSNWQNVKDIESLNTRIKMLEDEVRTLKLRLQK